MSYMDDLDVADAALLIMHYQADVFSILASDVPTDLLDRTNSLIARWRDTENPTIFANFAIDYRSPCENNMLISNIMKTGYFRDPAPVTGLDVAESDWRYACPRANVFHGTTLHQDLQAKGIKTLVMAGIATSGVLFPASGGQAMQIIKSTSSVTAVLIPTQLRTTHFSGRASPHGPPLFRSLLISPSPDQLLMQTMSMLGVIPAS